MADDFKSPTPRKAPGKSSVTSTLSTLTGAGATLLSLLSGLLAAALILFSGYVLYDTFYTQQQAKSSWDLLQYKPSIVETQDDETPVDLKNLLAEINQDYRAWLTVYETNIDYPVMQGSDDLYYAYHDIYKESSLTGAIYLAAGNAPDMSDSYNLIYGHHMDNGAMFGGLDRYRARSYFESHREGILVSQSAVYDLYAFAVAETDAYQNRIYAVGNRMGDVLAFLRANVADADATGTNRSADTLTLYWDEAPLEGVQKIVALSTCAAASTNGRLVVFYVATERDINALPSPTPAEPGTTPAPTSQPEATPVERTDVPPLDFFNIFHPRGTGRKVWALVNLICLIVTFYLFIPLLHLRAKYGRASMMGKINENERELRSLLELDKEENRIKIRLLELVREARSKKTQAEADAGDVQEDEFGIAVETLFYKLRRFKRRFRIGWVLELIFAALALAAFILTEDMRLPMVLIDRWTPLMIVLILIVWVMDVRLIRYRSKVLADEEDAERARQEQEAAAAN